MERPPPDGPLNASGTLAGEAAAAAGGARGFSAAWTAVLAALMALLIVATVLGNALVMLAFVADSSLRTQNNFFLLNLAISDFLVGKAPNPCPSPGALGQPGQRELERRTWVPFVRAHAPAGGGGDGAGRTGLGRGRLGLVGRWAMGDGHGRSSWLRRCVAGVGSGEGAEAGGRSRRQAKRHGCSAGFCSSKQRLWGT